MGCSPPGSSCPWDSPDKILAWVAMSSSRGSSQPRDWIEPASPAAPALQTDSLPLSHQGRHNIFSTFLWIWNYSEIESVLKIILWGHVLSATREMSLEMLTSGECLGRVRLSPPSSPQILGATLWNIYYSPHFTALNDKTMWTNIIHESSLCESEVQREQSPICWLKPSGQTWQSCDWNLVRLTLKHMFISVPHMFPRIPAFGMGWRLGKVGGTGGNRPCGPCYSMSGIWGHRSFLGRILQPLLSPRAGVQVSSRFHHTNIKKVAPPPVTAQDGGAGAGSDSNTATPGRTRRGLQVTPVTTFRIPTPGTAFVPSGA